MWIEKRKDYLLACERFYDEILDKNVKLSVKINKDTAQERKKALKQLEQKWSEKFQKSKDLTLVELGKIYFEDAVGRLKPQTIQRDQAQYDRAVTIVGDALVDKLTAQYIKAKLKPCGKPNVTLNGYIKILKIVIRWAYKNDLTDNIRVCDRLQNFPDTPKREKIQDKFLQKDELEKLIAGMECEHWKMFTEFLALTGMRIGELIALTDSDVDLKTKTIKINKTWSNTMRQISTTKTLSSIRDIHIQKELFQLANKIKKWSAERKMITGERNDIFFVNPDGKRVVYDVYEKYLRENSERILGRKITAHVLRHTFVSLYSAKGLSLEQISRQVGHANSRITKDIYYHVTDLQRQQDAAALDKISIFAH